MRYSKEHKLETHARIVKKASVRLREKGAHGIGVADLMKDAGLTHGGFYAHFDSREALVIEAFAYAMDRSTERWRKLAEETPPEKRLAIIVDSYLTQIHRDDPGHGCAMPTLGAEIARESPKTRKAFAAKLDQMIDMLADQIPDVPRKAARKQAMAAIATMMGTLVLARIAGSANFPTRFSAPGATPCWAAPRRRSRWRRNPGPAEARQRADNSLAKASTRSARSSRVRGILARSGASSTAKNSSSWGGFDVCPGEHAMGLPPVMDLMLKQMHQQAVTPFGLHPGIAIDAHHLAEAVRGQVLADGDKPPIDGRLLDLEIGNRRARHLVLPRFRSRATRLRGHRHRNDR